MVGTGKGKNRRTGSLLLLILFGLGLACLGLPVAAASRASDGSFVATDWARRYNGPANGYDYANALAVDGQGNVYVTGSSDGFGTNDYLTIKYRSRGQRLWVKRYKGPTGSDRSTAIAVDGQGNVYITGWSAGFGTDWDYATIKYSPDGEELWVRRYNGPANGGDLAAAIAVDGQGNVYVTGSSWGSGFGTDFATIKYGPDGEELWVRRYDGKGAPPDYDYATALAVDSQGNVFVTGSTVEKSGVICYTTIKYSPDGQRLWIRRYNGGYEPIALVLDAQGNVYVTGTVYILKYSPDGQRLWVRRFPGSAFAMAMDRQGNVYVTGDSSSRIATLKYSPSGQRLWRRYYVGPENLGDHATVIALDGQENVYVSGYSRGSGTESDYVTIKYSQTP